MYFFIDFLSFCKGSKGKTLTKGEKIMSIKKHEKNDLLKDDYFTVNGVVARTKTSADGKQNYEPIRKFLYKGRKVGLNISIEVHTTVDGKNVKVPLDVLCFQESIFDGILELNLDTGSRVTVFGRSSKKADSNSLIIDDPNWITVQKAI